MATLPNASVVFLPWVRQGAAGAITTPDTLGGDMRGAVSLTAALTINGVHSVAVPLRLRGPADVVGIDPNEVVRVDPKPNTTDFEPNYFPAIEFDRPDFPWLFTPAAAGAGAKLRPWLCLVVVRKQNGVIVSSSADAPLPVLSITAPARPGDELPTPEESWAWAHAQVAAKHLAAPSVLRDELRTRPERSLSRLLCPRVLRPNTEYIACVVPTFELGRRAGLGEDITEAEVTAANTLAPAWSLTPAPSSVTLPVFYQWQFRTGEVGDFESLVRLLRALPAPDGLGTRPMDISQPGFALPSTFPSEARLALEGALRPMGRKQLAPWPQRTQDTFQTELAKIVNTPGEAKVQDPNSDPLLAPPLYGQWHAARSPSIVARDAAPWFDELNLDPRHRSVAAFGTRVVQEHQEPLMAAAWEQVGDLQNANQRMRQLQVSLAAGSSVYTRNLARLSDAEILKISAPVLGRVRAGSIDALETGSLAAKLGATALPLQAASPAMRRIARERGPISRRVAAQGVARAPSSTWLRVLNSPAALTFLTPALPDMATFDAVRARAAVPHALSPFQDVTAAAVASAGGRPEFRVMPEGQGPAAWDVRNLPASADSATAAHFRAAAQAHLARVNPGRTSPSVARRPELSLQQIRETVMAQLQPRRTLVALANAVVAMATDTTVSMTAPTNAGMVPIEPIMAAPKFPRPMYEPLRDLSQELLLPGLDTVEPNSVLGLETNARFVEAYMVGLNYEMGRELLWRGYPTDQRGTYFERFWDSRAAGGDADVFPLHEWNDRPLGDPRTAPSRDRFVMLIRSALLRRYPTAVIYAAKATDVDGVRKPSGKPEDEEHPAFRGSMQPDVTFFGFDLTVDQVVGGHPGAEHGYFIVIQEQPTEPRFGVDVGTPLGDVTHLTIGGGTPAGASLNGRTWGQNGAHMAAILRQQPVRIAIHASQFLRRS